MTMTKQKNYPRQQMSFSSLYENDFLSSVMVRYPSFFWIWVFILQISSLYVHDGTTIIVTVFKCLGNRQI